MQHPQVNKFFFKFFNYNVQDQDMLALVPYELYQYVAREITFYNNNQESSRMDLMQFNVFLFNLIKLNYRSMHDKLVADIENLNSK